MWSIYIYNVYVYVNMSIQMIHKVVPQKSLNAILDSDEHISGLAIVSNLISLKDASIYFS